MRDKKQEGNKKKTRKRREEGKKEGKKKKKLEERRREKGNNLVRRFSCFQSFVCPSCITLFLPSFPLSSPLSSNHVRRPKRSKAL